MDNSDTLAQNWYNFSIQLIIVFVWLESQEIPMFSITKLNEVFVPIIAYMWRTTDSKPKCLLNNWLGYKY